jgi:hypothetical protein
MAAPAARKIPKTTLGHLLTATLARRILRVKADHTAMTNVGFGHLAVEQSQLAAVGNALQDVI